ncbi:MAG: hypothetical protein HZA32_18915 [Opitutae bacterium]|nr:hypothetical protein [Opitutae bacterium]
MNWLRWLSPLLGVAVLSFVVANTILPFHGAVEERQFHNFEVTLSSTVGGTAQLFYNAGRKFNETDSARVPVAPGPAATLRFRLNAEVVRELRFDPIDGDGTVTIAEAVIRRPDGSVLHRFAPEDFKAANQIARTSVRGDTFVLETTSGANDAYLNVALHTDLIRLPVKAGSALLPMLGRAVPVFVVLALLVGAAIATWPRLSPPLARAFSRLRAWAAANPRGFIAAVAALAVVLSTYPVVFLGASLVSPNYGTVLLYDGFPTLPGAKEAAQVDVRGADVGAIMWQHVPMTAVQSRGIYDHFEIPLWNRYNSAGTPLLGQGQMMIGDPLNTLVALAGGNAWAWDLKYLAAKWLLGFGLGLVVWHITRQRLAAALVAFAAVFSGFFAFRANHPAFFSFCYGPWILYAWCRLCSAETRRGLYWSAVGLVVTNAAMITSGTAKEAYVSVLSLNFVGAVLVLCSAAPWRERARRTGIAAAAGTALLLVTAPLWLTFVDTIRSSYSSYNETFAYQLQPSLLLGLFDEALLRPLWEGERVFNPSSNFLLLAGVLLFLANLRAAAHNRFALGFALAALVPLAFVFGLVPPQWIANWPFFGNIHHIDNSFGVGLIHLCAVLAGVGFAQARARFGTPEGRGDLAVGALLLFALVFLYLGFTQAVHRSTYTYLHWGETVPRSDFVWGYFASLLAALAGLAWAVDRSLRRRALSAGVVLFATACTLTLLWKHGMQVHSPYPGQTLDAAPRQDFFARSAAMEALHADARGEPGRAVGLHNNLFSGWSSVYDVEGINGGDALMNPYVRQVQEAFGIPRIWDWRLYFDPAELGQTLPFLNLFNVRYIVDLHSDQGVLGRWLKPVRMADLDLYRNEAAWPRAFFTDRVAVYEDVTDFAALVRGDPARPLAAIQAQDAGELPASLSRDASTRQIVPATRYALTNNRTEFEINAPGPGVVVLTEAWIKGDFRAELDGRTVPYLRLNHAFKGIVIDRAGSHRIAFRYVPRHFDLALGLAAFGLAGLIAAGWRWGRRERAAAP